MKRDQGREPGSVTPGSTNPGSTNPGSTNPGSTTQGRGKPTGKKSGLAGRLSRIRESRKIGPEDPDRGLSQRRSYKGPCGAEKHPGDRNLDSRVAGGRANPGSRLWQDPLPGWDSIGEACFRRSFFIPFPGDLLCFPDPPAEPLLFSSQDYPDRFVFYDLETTGLSGGAGTHIFLAAFLLPSRKLDGLELIQLFMADYPGEPAFLEAIGNICSGDKLYISYNGKGFDRHILRSRFIMQGLQLSMGRQLDLLHIARRLWKRMLPDCTLSRIEEMVLQLKRKEDIPGKDIPDRYFRWLKEGDPGVLKEVFAHHIQDLLSLYTLLDRIEGMAADPADASAEELTGLGSLFLQQGRSRGGELLLAAWKRGDLQGGHRAILACKRSRRYEDALELALDIWEKRRSSFAGLEAAKLLEHRKRDYSRALAIVDTMLAQGGSESEVLSLTYRRDRLARRM